MVLNWNYIEWCYHYLNTQTILKSGLISKTEPCDQYPLFLCFCIDLDIHPYIQTITNKACKPKFDCLWTSVQYGFSLINWTRMTNSCWKLISVSDISVLKTKFRKSSNISFCVLLFCWLKGFVWWLPLLQILC